ncbi:MAG: HNH endonuclease [Treponemataceae bacterium]
MSFTEKDREEIFKNAKGKCESCGKQLIESNHTEGGKGAWEAHHKTSKASGGSDCPSNGKALCLDCHKDTF